MKIQDTYNYQCSCHNSSVWKKITSDYFQQNLNKSIIFPELNLYFKMFSNYSNYIALFLAVITTTCCTSKVFKVSNSEEFQKALENASPGDNISLSGNTTFEGIFHAAKNGSRDSPITLLTEDSDKDKTFNAKLIGVGGDAGEATLTITGNYYDLRNISIGHNNSLALLIEGTDISLYGVGIKNADKAVRIEGALAYMKDCYISQVGSGIQMGGDFGIVRDTFVTGGGIVSVVAEKKTCCGTLMGNVFDGKVDIKGTDFNLFDNVIEGKSQL